MSDTPVVEQPKTEQPKIDPFVEGLAKSFGKVLDPTVEPEKAITGPLPPIIPLAAVVARNRELEEQKAKETPKEEPKPGEVKTPAEAPKTTQEPPKEETPVAKPIKLKKRAEAKPEPLKEEPKETPKPSETDEEYIKGLTPEQQEELQLAQFAEANGKKGLFADTLAYYRKVDGWAKEHPDTGPDSEEFKEFTEQNRPKLSSLERRRLERQMIVEEAKAKVREEIAPEVEEQKRKVLEIQTKPLIDDAINSLDEHLTGKPPTAELAPIKKGVIQVLKTEGYEKALEKYPVEAPIVAGTRTAVQEWLAISNRVAKFNPANETHAFLVKFITEEGTNMKRQKATRDGKEFLPLHEFNKLAREKPEEAEKFYTFDDEMVVNLLAERAVLAVNAGIKKLRAAGYRLESEEVSPQAGNPAATTTPSTGGGGGSPKAGARAIPGATDIDETPNPNAAFLEQLYPGASKIIAGR